jgi:hypothetical protein
VISIIKQIQARIIREAKWLRWVWRECKRKARYKIYKIKHQFLLKPSHKDGKHKVQNSRGQQLKRRVSMAIAILPLETRQIASSPSNKGKSNQAPNSIKDTNSPQ